jgi:hypothetical protein
LLFAAIGLFATAIGLLSWYVQSKYAASITEAGRIGLDVSSLKELFYYNLSHRYGEEVLTHYGLFAAMAGTTGDVFYETVRRLAVVYVLFAAYALYLGLVLQKPILKKIWVVYVVTNLFLLVGFSFFNSFLVSRYTLATALTILLLAPFAINRLLLRWPHVNVVKKAMIGFALFIATVVSLEGLDVSTNKRFVREGGEWMANNLPKDASIYSNSRIAIF